MTVQWQRETDRLIVCRVSGQLRYEEWLQLNAGGENPMPETGKLRALILLEHFSGWDNDEGWADLSWVDENDERLDRVACVGEERWRAEMEVFMLKDLRPVEIRYFGPGEEALARFWLEGD